MIVLGDWRDGTMDDWMMGLGVSLLRMYIFSYFFLSLLTSSHLSLFFFSPFLPLPFALLPPVFAKSNYQARIRKKVTR